MNPQIHFLMLYLIHSPKWSPKGIFHFTQSHTLLTTDRPDEKEVGMDVVDTLLPKGDNSENRFFFHLH